MNLALNLSPIQQNVLDGQHRDGHSMHLGTHDGVLTITVHDDSAGAHVQVELKDAAALRAIVATHLVCQPNLPSLRISAVPGTERAVLWVGACRFAVPFKHAGLVHAWLARHIRPRSSVAELPPDLVATLHALSAKEAA